MTSGFSCAALYGAFQSTSTLLQNKLKPSVVMLTGMGGIGKTTLAHAIFHHPEIVSHFAFRRWVTVGDRDLDPNKVLNKLNDVTDDTLSEATKKVRSALEGKKRFLIVLDDVCDAEDLRHRWNELWVSLSHGGKGSRVMVTTREERVLCSMQCLRVQVKRLGLLSDKECLKIFEAFAFPDELFDIPSSSSSSPINLRELGKEIVNKKVKGIPLAACVIGSSLRSKADKYWNAALEQIKETDINSAILWSYLNLSTHLKQCFVYCSLFPKDTSLDKTTLVQLWMAHSLVVQSNTQYSDGKTLVDIAESYLDDLVNASLIYQDKDVAGIYKMHDIIHDFALNILGEEFSEGKDSMIVDPQNLRHLVIAKDQKLPQNISDIKNLRTFISRDPFHINNLRRDQLKTVRSLLLHSFQKKKVSKTFVIDLFKKLSRVRYLDISQIEISTLPESVCSMCALQTLILDDDTIHFPNNMSKQLVELHHIEAGDNVSRISRLGQLKKLHSIGDRFILVENNGHRIEELRNLRQLRGKLEIRGLAHVQCGQFLCNEQLLNNNEHLKGLVLDMYGVKSNVLDYLQPHKNLKALEIQNYHMDQLSSWLGNSDVKIVSLELSDCSVKKLPPLGHLPLLRSLIMKQLNEIEHIDGEFYGGDRNVAFPSLEKLVLKRMHRLTEWKEFQAISSDQSSTSYFPSLKEFTVEDCLQLRNLPLFPSSLEHLVIGGSDSLHALPTKFPCSLKYLRIISCGNLESLPKEIPSLLERLEIYFCNSLQTLPDKLPSALEHLEIVSCSSLHDFPKELPSSLKCLKIHYCNSLYVLPMEFPSSLKVSIHCCPLLYRRNAFNAVTHLSDNPFI